MEDLICGVYCKSQSARCHRCPRPLHLGPIHPIIGSTISRCSLHNSYFKRVLQADSSLYSVPPNFLILLLPSIPSPVPLPEHQIHYPLSIL